MYITAEDVEDFIGKYPEDSKLPEQYAKAAQKKLIITPTKQRRLSR